jgi:hypothetical protein
VVSKLHMEHLLGSIYLCACMRTVVNFVFIFQNTSPSIDMLVIRIDRRGTRRMCLFLALTAVWCSVVTGILQLQAECVSVVRINTERIQSAVVSCRFFSILSRLLPWVEVRSLLLRYSVFRYKESVMLDVVRCWVRFCVFEPSVLFSNSFRSVLINIMF